jgi:broad specificity phosphatase PhoE
MKTIYFIRHGETESNKARTTGVATDPLSSGGQDQAQRIAERFKTIPTEIIISSPFRRARQTADAIATYKQVELVESNLFIEVASSQEIEGTHIDDPTVAHIRQKRTEYWGVRGAHYSNEENFYDADERAVQALRYLAERPESEIVVVTHGAFMRSMVERIILGDLLTPEIATHMYNRMVMSNTGVTVVTLDLEGWHLIRWNDTIHLEV